MKLTENELKGNCFLRTHYRINQSILHPNTKDTPKFNNARDTLYRKPASEYTTL